jgi:polyisoprenoid-binding protein YceI
MSTITPAAIPSGTWAVDPSHSRVEFAVRHMGIAIATVRGHFGQFEGALELPDDHAGARASGLVHVDSIDTNQKRRDAHLRSADFFDAENHPEITFSSTRIERGDVNQLLITGDLTMRGVTRNITLTATAQGTDTDPDGNERVALEIVAELSRVWCPILSDALMRHVTWAASVGLARGR